MKALVVIDVQNEFSPAGRRPIRNHSAVLAQIKWRIEEAKALKLPIAWIRHYNRPNESPAFIPGTWGSELSPELGVELDSPTERLFEKDVFGAFTGTELEAWLRSRDVNEVLLVGFFTHMCVSTSAREALMRGFSVFIDPEATGTRDLAHPVLGRQTADEVRRSALLQLADLGVEIVGSNQHKPEVAGALHAE